MSWSRASRAALLAAEDALLKAFVQSPWTKSEVPVHVRQPAAKGFLSFCQSLKAKGKAGSPSPAPESVVSSEAAPGFSAEAINSLHVRSTAATASSAVPAVLTHGYGSGLAMFFHNYDHLAARYGSVYALDWLGMGGSTRPKLRSSVFGALADSRRLGEITDEDASRGCEAVFVDSLECWRKAMGLEKMDLLAHSMGGYLSAAYTLAHPDRVRNLILVSPAGLLPRPVSEPTSPALAVTPAAARQQRSFNLLFDKLITPQAFVRAAGPMGPRLVNAAVAARFRNMPAAEVAFIAAYMYHVTALGGSTEYALNVLFTIVTSRPGAGLYAYWPLVPRLQAAGRKATVVFGDHDWMQSSISAADVAAMHAAGVHATEIGEAGHHLYLDNPKGFSEAIASVLDGKPGPRARGLRGLRTRLS